MMSRGAPKGAHPSTPLFEHVAFSAKAQLRKSRMCGFSLTKSFLNITGAPKGAHPRGYMLYLLLSFLSFYFTFILLLSQPKYLQNTL